MICKEKINNGEIIIKNNNIADISCKLTTQEQQMLIWLIRNIKEEDIDFKKYPINAKKLCKIINIEYDQKIIEETMLNLMKKVLSIKNIKNNTTCQTSWINCVEYYIKEKIITISFDPSIKPLFLYFKNHLNLLEQHLS